MSHYNHIFIAFALFLSCFAGYTIAILFKGSQPKADFNPNAYAGELPNVNIIPTEPSEAPHEYVFDANQLALVDHLTQLPNRRAMMQYLEAAINRSERNGTRLALAFIDVDNFKKINDSLGHNVGDSALQVIAKRLVTAVRGCDEVARIGGDEFIAIIEDVENHQDCIATVERMVHSVRESCVIDHAEMHLSVSIGVALYQNSGDIEALINAADKAMYRAKKDGKNQYRFFDEEIALAAEQLLEMQYDIKNALANDEFVMHYQIKIDSITRTPVGAEAFLRWQHPTRGLLSPADFMDAAERVGNHGQHPDHDTGDNAERDHDLGEGESCRTAGGGGSSHGRLNGFCIYI